MHIFIARDPESARWVALQHYHEVATDANTILIVHQEVQAHLSNRAGQLPPPVPYRNFVAQVRSSDFEEYHKAFFHKMLADVSEPTMPFGLADVYRDGTDFVEARQPVDESLAMRLQASARASRVSVASIFHLAWALVLARVSGRDDVVFGTVLSGRMRGGSGGAPAPGLFINTLPVRIAMGEENVLNGLRHTHTLLSQLLLHEHAPLALAQRCSALAAPIPLFSSMLNYRQDAAVKAHALLEGMQWLDFEERSNYPLSLSVDQLGEGFALTVQVVAGIDPQRVCTYMHTALERVVDAWGNVPATPLRSLDVMPEAERHRLLVEWNDTSADYPRDQSIQQLFEVQAARAPEAIAVACEGGELSYGELNARANRLAHHLISLGVGPETLVGVCLERSAALIVGLLGILKAGGAYVPLDPNYPPARLAFMLTDTQAPVLLTQEVLLGQLPPYEGHILCLDRDWDAIAGEPDSDPPCRTTAENVAYVIYTSGSTGEPKGVVLTHANATAFLAWANRIFGRAAMERTLFSTSICFDLSIFELFAPLVSGCTVLLVRDALELSEAPLALAPSLLNTVPSAAQALVDARALPTGLRTICLAGEPLRAELVAGLRDAAPEAHIYNLYGPTECTTYATCCEISRGARITIGRPVSNTRVYILDGQLRPVPIGVSGEIYLAGAGLARGYLNRPALTAEKFVAVPFSSMAGARMYRTGDLARYLPDGNIEFLGRLDDQVKIRGYRIELGEIEAVLCQNPAVRQAVARAREDIPGNKRLVAYVVPADPAVRDMAPLRDYLRERLPDFMRPAAFVVLDALPLTANGKIDHKALPAPGEQAFAAGRYEAPVGKAENTIAEIWATMLRVEKVGRHDSFFDLGGDSLQAMAFVAQLQERIGVELPIAMVFETPTLAALADQIRIDDETTQSGKAGAENTAQISFKQGTGTAVPGKSAAIDEILARQRDFLVTWKGKRLTPQSLIFTRNGSGRRRGLFWCCQGNNEFQQLAKHLGPDQPVHGMRSGHLILKNTDANVSALAAHYCAEMIALQPEGSFQLGGNCQGAMFARAIALQLRALGRTVVRLILMEPTTYPVYEQPATLIFGKDSDLNPFNPQADPEALLHRELPSNDAQLLAEYFRSDNELNPFRPEADPEDALRQIYPAGFKVEIVTGTHGAYFKSPNIENLASTLRKHLTDLS